MASSDYEGNVDESAAHVARSGAANHSSATVPADTGPMVGSPEHLQSTFGLATAAADRAVGLWLARTSRFRLPDDVAEPSEQRSSGEFSALRALVRASAIAYARRLRDEGATPERMLVLVKAAAHHGIPGSNAQELTNDVVRWSIEAYFDH